MKALSEFLRRELLALLGDDAPSADMSEDSESQPWSEPPPRAQPGDAPRVVLGGKTDSAAQTVVLVDGAHCMTAVVAARVADALRARLGFQSLGRLNGSVIRVDRYRFVTRARCLQTEQLALSARAGSVSLASSARRQQRVYLLVEELSVLHESELAVKQRPDAMEDPAVVKRLDALNDDELEARLSSRQKLPPLAANPRPASPQQFDDRNPLTDTDCIIPDDQERELDEQDGWGVPTATDSNPLLTDSQLIAENGPVSMTESQEPSQMTEGDPTEYNAVSVANEVEMNPDTPPSPRGEHFTSKEKAPGQVAVHHQSSSETEDELESNQSPRGRGVDADSGSVVDPIDLTGDDGDSQTTANLMYGDSQLFTQAPDGESQLLQDVKWSQVERETDQEVENLLYHTQPLDDEEKSEHVGHSPAQQESEERHVGGQGEMHTQGFEDIPRSSIDPDATNNKETTKTSDSKTGRPNPEVTQQRHESVARAEDRVDSRQSRGLVGSFFRRLPSLFGIGTSPAKPTTDQAPESSSRAYTSSSSKSNQSEDEDESEHPDDVDSSLPETEQPSGVVVADDVDRWQTQAPDTFDEDTLSPADNSFDFNPGYEDEEEDADWNSAAVAAGAGRNEASPSSAGRNQAVDESGPAPDIDEMPASGSVWVPSQSLSSPPSQGKKRTRADSSSPRRPWSVSSSPSQEVRPTQSPPSLGRQRCQESEEQKENENPEAPKRHRVDGAPNSIKPANITAPPFNLTQRVSISSIFDEGNGGPFRPSKRYASLFPPLDMDRIKLLISQRR